MKWNPIFIVYIKKVEKYKPTQILIGKDIQSKKNKNIFSANIFHEGGKIMEWELVDII